MQQFTEDEKLEYVKLVETYIARNYGLKDALKQSNITKTNYYRWKKELTPILRRDKLIEDLSKKLETLKDELEDLKNRNNELYNKNSRLLGENFSLDRKVKAFYANEQYKKEDIVLKQRIQNLESQITHNELKRIFKVN